MPIDAVAYRRMYELEDEHWWFDGMEAITARLLGILPNAQSGQWEILDAGCGTGRALRFLGRFGRVTGLDYSPIALGCCVERGAQRLVCGSVNTLPFPDRQFDLVTSFDMLMTEGVDDTAALAEFVRVLRPGGSLLLRVPAYNWLRSHHDQEWAVARRYHRPSLRAKLAATGLEVHRASYANMWLLPIALLKRFAERWAPPAKENSDLQIGAGRSLSGKVLQTILASEARVVAGKWGLPCGLSLFALARKPPDR
jgi:SAM-dependent methyltransferase